MLNISNRLYKALVNPVVKENRAGKRLYPSSASVVDGDNTYGSCHRKEYYKWYDCKEDEGEINADHLLMALAGDCLHSMIGNLLRVNNFRTGLDVVGEEHSFYDKYYMLSGRCDLLLRDNTTGTLSGVDIKTVGEGVMSSKPSVVDFPKMDHIIQCMVYLDQYNKISDAPFEEWIILYMARSDSWKLKKHPHGSMLRDIWEFSVKIDPTDGHAIIENQHGQITHLSITIDAIYLRYETLLDYISRKKLPPRDYSYQFTEEELLGMYKTKKLNKGDSEKVEKWIKKKAPTGVLNLDKGDSECKYCRLVGTCYSNDPETFDTKPTKVISSGIIPTKVAEKPKDIPTNLYI